MENLKEGRKKNRIESRMTKGSPDYKKGLVSIKGARGAPSSTKGDLVTLSGKAGNAAEKGLVSKLANDAKGVKKVKKPMTNE